MDKYYIINVLEYDEICEATYAKVYSENAVILIFRTKQDAMDKMKAIVVEQETLAEGNPYNVEFGDDYVDYGVNGFGITSRRMEIIEARIV